VPPEGSEPLALAFRYLNRRERTVTEVRAHLQVQGAEAGDLERVIAELIEQGYLDDQRYARLFAEEKRQLQQWGQERIRRSLEAHGIEPALAAAAAGQPGDGQGETERALELLRRRIPHAESGRRGRERALGVLLRRGYEYEVADQAVRIHLGAADAPDER
jgi:regulatory protein